MKIKLYIHKKDETILKKFIKLSGKHINIDTYLKNFIAGICQIGAQNLISMTLDNQVSYETYKKMKVKHDTKFKVPDSYLHEVDVQDVIYDSIKNLFKLENALNTKQKKKLHPSIEAYLFLLVNDKIQSMENELNQLTEKHL